MPLTIVSIKTDPKGINLTLQVKDLYSENNKTLMKETDDDTNKSEDIL